MVDLSIVMLVYQRVSFPVKSVWSFFTPPPSMRDVRGLNGKITSPSRPGSSLDPSHVIIDAPAGVIKHVWEIPGINGGVTVENPIAVASTNLHQLRGPHGSYQNVLALGADMCGLSVLQCPTVCRWDWYSTYSSHYGYRIGTNTRIEHHFKRVLMVH